MSRISIDN